MRKTEEKQTNQQRKKTNTNRWERKTRTASLYLSGLIVLLIAQIRFANWKIHYDSTQVFFSLSTFYPSFFIIFLHSIRVCFFSSVFQFCIFFSFYFYSCALSFSLSLSHSPSLSRVFSSIVSFSNFVFFFPLVVFPAWIFLFFIFFRTD